MDTINIRDELERVWYPNRLYRKNHGRIFGPNGAMRGYIHNNKLNDLNDLCQTLSIRGEPDEPGDYVDFLLDVSENADRLNIPKWEKCIKNAITNIAENETSLSEDQKKALQESKIIVFDKELLQPEKCFLIRAIDKIFADRMVRSRIRDVPFIFENDPHMERLYISLGMNEIYDYISQRRTDEGHITHFKKWNVKISKLGPWVNGYSFHTFGKEGIMDLGAFKSLEIHKVSDLGVQYGLEYGGDMLTGESINDFCCLEIHDSGANVLYLDQSFNENIDEHVSFLSTLLTKLIDPGIEIKKVEWVMLLNQYFRFGTISGINPYSHKTHKEPAVEAESSVSLQEESDESWVEGESEEVVPVELESWDDPEEASKREDTFELPTEKVTTWDPECKPKEAEIHGGLHLPAEMPKNVAPLAQVSTPKGFSNKSKTKTTKDVLSYDVKVKIGRWGEEYCLKYLLKKYTEKYPQANFEKTDNGFIVCEQDKTIVEVYWENRLEDRGVGFDIKLVENNIEQFIEVKSTKTDDKEWFEISQRQWEFAKEKGEKFHFFRVKNAGSKKEANVNEISNPIKLWDEGKLVGYPLRMKI